MKFRILGSGGAIPTPRPLCQCEICTLARKNDKYKRNSSSAYIEEINTLIDCPEDIADSLNRQGIQKIDHLFITHWHPDHTFGLRVLLEANYDFIENKAKNQIKIYIARKVYTTLKEKYPALIYLTDVLKLAKIQFIEHKKEIVLGDIKITPIGYQGKESEVYSFLFKKDNKKLVYAPCDTLHWKTYDIFCNLDILVHECGIFSYDKLKSELSFPELLKRIKIINPQKTILTHIEEIELNRWGLKKLDELKQKNLEFAYDGLVIDL
ncbi:MBL fold metallo-hydrolase [Candidatus Woesearchaeota archaeon]|nr:MBL fold metallo-hydrolase [Candidatus Woesearchaeota archaeon]